MFSIVIPHPKPVYVSDSLTDGLTWLAQLGVAHKHSDPQRIIGMTINGQLKDLSHPIHPHDEITWVTASSPQGVDILRHSMAHVLAQAVQELFDDVQVTIGPVIEHGFYYDFYRPTPFSTQDLPLIEQRMKDIIDRDLQVEREVWRRDEAVAFFRTKGEDFKVKIIEDLPEAEPLSFYRQGSFVDLCRGPHAPRTSTLGTDFALTKVSAAYWRGDAKQGVGLQRIYGTAWACAEDLKAYQYMIQEAEKRDHRKLAQVMELFHTQEEAPGSLFWHPKGWTIYQTLQDFMRQTLRTYGYVEVNTPQLVSQDLWESSGHWAKFREHMYAVHQDEMTYAMKPMNCPCHVQIYNHSLESYRDLPYRMSEFGRCMRHEPSGSRMGMMRVSSFVQDDAHIFCTPDQMIQETATFCHLLFAVYRQLGFDDVVVRLSTRPDTRLGTEEVWDHAEQSLKEGAEKAGLNYTLFPGEGAFYGPKLEFALKDCLGRLWQCGTLQADFVLPERLDAWYVGSDGQKHRPVMLHRAVLGSFERFIGVLLEHTAGHLPAWLTPVQVVIIPISQAHEAYARTIANQWPDIRCVVDARNEKMGYRMREHMVQKVPYIVVVGDREVADQTAVLRHQNQQEVLDLPSLTQRLMTATAMPSIALPSPA